MRKGLSWTFIVLAGVSAIANAVAPEWAYKVRIEKPEVLSVGNSLSKIGIGVALIYALWPTVRGE